jgi:hypothetical protein
MAGVSKIGVVIVAALFALSLAGCGGEDEEQTRRPAAIGPGEDGSGEDDKSSDPSSPTLFLTAVSGSSGAKGGPAPSGLVKHTEIEYGSLDPNVYVECVSAPSPGRSCVWNYLRHSYRSTYTVFVHLTAVPSQGALVEWTGCSGTGTSAGSTSSACLLTMSGNKTVKATFVVDPKG